MFVDFKIGKTGDLDMHTIPADVALTDSISQAIRIRLLWFLGEYIYIPSLGTSWLELLYIKKPEIEQIKQVISDVCFSVGAIVYYDNISVNIDSMTRKASIYFTASTDSGQIVLENINFG